MVCYNRKIMSIKEKLNLGFQFRRQRKPGRLRIAALATALATLGPNVPVNSMREAIVSQDVSIQETQPLILNAMGKFGEMDSRRDIQFYHQMEGLGTGYEHHASLIFSKQNNSLMEPDRFAINFADAYDMTYPSSSRPLSNARLHIIEHDNAEEERVIDLNETLFKDSNGSIISNHQIATDLSKGLVYDFIVRYTDNTGKDRSFRFERILPNLESL